MKKIYSLLLLVVASVSFGQTFYSENMGTPSGTTSIATNVFQNTTPIVYSGTGDVRSTSVSTGYPGASGGGNVFINAATEFFQIDGLNTTAYNTADIQLSFGYNAGGNVANLVALEFSTNGTVWTAIPFTPGATGWSLVTIPGSTIPSSATLSIRFTQPGTTQIRIDDVKLSNVSASCTLVLGTPITACEATTLGNDTYSVSIPFTGAGNGTYTIIPNSGTVGGDNPTSMAAGNIVVSGVTENTNFTATITGVTCNFTSSANSPECEPINPLPYRESFDYTVGNGLGASQMWTNVNSGDEILVATGSLSYPGITSSANHVTFTGAGIDCFTPHTTTTTGTVYASFIINVTSIDNVTTDGASTYFAGLTDATRGYNARVFIRKAGTQYQLGLDTASTTTNYDTALRNVGDVVFVVVGYDFGTNELKMWLNPDLTSFSAATAATLTNTPAATYTDLGGFILRQDGATNTPTILFDELRVATTTGQLLSVSQNEISGLNVYPNPTTGIFYVETALNGVKNITVYDILGKQVLNTTTASTEINAANLNSGLYIVKITEDGKTATKKLIIE